MPKILPQKKLVPLLTAVLSVGLFFLLAEPARAFSITDTALEVFGAIVGIVVDVLGQLLLMVISVLVTVAQFNNFIASPPVQEGWAIVRDICNMFFVLVLLLVAFATILHLQNYSVKQLFKRVIIFAILINFSKLFCGLIIDFSQVVMLTFVNAFKDIGGGNFSMLLGVDQLLAIDAQDFKNGADFWAIIGSYVLALIYVVMMLVVMVALLATLVYRIVMLWIYIILSPLAYLANIVPLMQGVSKQWWSQFFQQVATGPLLAFFIWLSLATLGQFSNSNQEWAGEMGFSNPDTPKNANLTSPAAGITQVGTVDHMLRFVVSLGLLIGGLVVSKSFGGSAGAAMSKVVGGAQKGAGWMKNKVAKPLAKYAAKKTWQTSKWAGRRGLALAQNVDYGASKYARGGAHWARDRFRKEEDRTDFKYKHDQGLLTRVGAGVRQNVFTKQGWKDNFNGLTREMGVETNRKVNQQRAAAKEAGYHKKDDVTYVYRQETGEYESKRKNEKGEEEWTGNVWQEGGKAVKVMSDFTARQHNYLHASKAETALDNAAVAQDKKELEDLAEPYKDMAKEEIWSIMKGTADPKKRLGMMHALSKEGNLRQGMYAQAMELLKNNPTNSKTFRDNTLTKQAEEALNFYDEDQMAAFKKLVAKRKIKLEDQNLATLDFNDPNPERAEANRQKLADLTGAFREAMHKEGWGNTINKVDKEGDPAVAKKLAEALGILSDRQENNADQVRGKSAAALAKYDTQSAKVNADLANNKAGLADKNREIAAAVAIDKQNPTMESHKKVTALVGERKALEKQRTLLEKQQALLSEKNKAKKIADENIAKKYDREAFALRSDRLTLDLDGDFVKSFSTRDIKNSKGKVTDEGRFDSLMAGDFFGKASAKQLAQINPEKLLRSEHFGEVIKLAAEKVSFERLKSLERSGNNPELARMIAEEQYKNIKDSTNTKDKDKRDKLEGLYSDISSDSRPVREARGVKLPPYETAEPQPEPEPAPTPRETITKALKDSNLGKDFAASEMKDFEGYLKAHGPQDKDLFKADTTEEDQANKEVIKELFKKYIANKPAAERRKAAGPDYARTVKVEQTINNIIKENKIKNESEGRDFTDAELASLRNFVRARGPKGKDLFTAKDEAEIKANNEALLRLIDEFNVVLKNRKNNPPT